MEQRHLVLNANSRKNRLLGFTLLESIMALFLFSVICMLASGYVKNAQVIGSHLQNTSEKEWHIFLIQLEKELEGCRLISAEANLLTFHDVSQNYTVLIEFKKNKIVKSANGGYQPMLMRVEAVVFKQEKQRVQIQLRFENGKSREAVLIL